MKKHKTLGNALSMLTASALLLSLCVIPSAAADSAAAPAAVFENTSGDGGSNGISLSAERTFQASIPVDMTEAEAKEAASSVTWTLTPDADAPDYLDDTQFPNQTEGGPLSAWLCQDGETPFFTDVATAAETVDGQVYLTSATSVTISVCPTATAAPIWMCAATSRCPPGWTARPWALWI